MLRHFLILSLFLFISLGTAAQSLSDTISVKRTFGGVKFERFGTALSPQQVQKMMQPVPAAFEEMKAARANNTAANIIGGAGGFLVGFTLGSALAGDEVNWTMAAIGGGLVAVSIPFSIKFRQRSTKAVRLYNSGVLQQQGMAPGQLKLGLSPSSLRLRLDF